jgi:hypothetical protein
MANNRMIGQKARQLCNRFGHVLLLAAALLAAGFPSATQAAEVVFPPALRIGMAPPAGFAATKNFPGFQNAEARGAIIMAELPANAFEALEKEVAAELQRNPALVPQRRDIQFKDGGSGIVLGGRQDTPEGAMLKWTLIGRLGDLTAIVTALLPEQSKDAVPEAAIHEAFASLSLRPPVAASEQLEALPFTVAELSGFRLGRVQPGSAALLTEGPKDDIDAAEQPLLLVSVATGQMPQPGDRDTVARRMFGSIPGLTDVRITRSEAQRIGGLAGHEVLADAKDPKTGTELTAVQWVRFGTAGLIRMVAVARKDQWASLYPRLRAVRDGIDPR